MRCRRRPDATRPACSCDRCRPAPHHVTSDEADRLVAAWRCEHALELERLRLGADDRREDEEAR